MRIIALLVCVILMISAAAAGEDSDRADPEGLFYPLKIWMEKLSLNFIFDQNEKDWRMLDLAERRLEEAEGSENDSRAFERAMEEYAGQLEELNDIVKKDTDNATTNMRARIKERIENHTNRTKALKSPGRVSVIQQSIIEAGGGITVSAVNGNVSVRGDGNATITRDGGNVTVVSVTNNSRQVVIIRSTQNNSYSSWVSVRSEASSGD